MSKLYGLYVVEDATSILSFMCGSNEIDKLKSITFVKDHCWHVCGQLDRDKHKKMTHTTDDVYPYYVIYEIPYVC